MTKVKKIEAEDYLLGIKVIDDEHKILIGYLNQLLDPQPDLNRLVKGLHDYTRTHFTVEEELMKSHCYPGLGNHQVEHHEFISKVAYLEKYLSDGGNELQESIKEFLTAWLTTHIDKSDRKMTRYLTEAGIIA